jgi:hypothetical protein
MRRLLLVALVLMTVAGAYAAMPFVAAWQIREAVRTGDIRTLEARVDWQAVRQSLKISFAESRAAIAELAGFAGEPRPTLWQRVKAAARTAVFPYVTDPLIDRYVTAEGAPRLYAWRQTWRQRVRPHLQLGEAPTLLAGTWLAGTSFDRSLSLARRIERFRFASPTRVELELADKYREERRWLAALELRAQGWQLTEMRVLAEPRGLRGRLVRLR